MEIWIRSYRECRLMYLEIVPCPNRVSYLCSYWDLWKRENESSLFPKFSWERDERERGMYLEENVDLSLLLSLIVMIF